jgi:hypothetical protein
MKFKSLLFICLLFCFSISYSQNKVVKKTADGYEVTINTENLKGKRIELCLHYGLYNEKTIVDSVTIKSDNQKVVFAKTQKVYDAIYVLRIANQIGTIDLVIDDGEKLIINLNKPDITAIAIAKIKKIAIFCPTKRIYPKRIAKKV